MDYLGKDIINLKSGQLTLSNAQEKKVAKIPLYNKNSLLVNWVGKWKDTFRHYSYLDVLNNYTALLEGKRTNIDTAIFKDSICLVGITAIGLYELKPVPLEPVYPSIGILATAIDNILNSSFITVSPLWLIIIFVYILAFIPALFITGEKPLKSIVITLAFGITFFIASLLLFKNNFLLNFSLPLLTLGCSYLSIATYNFIRVSVEKQKYFQLSINDGLTGLYNIRYFKMVLKAECLMANDHPNKQFCIVMCDVDHFKRFNDDYGHQVGDSVLKEVASVLKKTVRASDLTARYGGEEMIILLRNTTLDNAIIIAEKIRKEVENNLVKDKNRTYKVTISIGVSRFNNGDDEDTIIKRADDALYKAKASGRNRVDTIEK
ncbi:MAG: diguanylate cyclase [Candidatus Omnitrophica bacterium]|jgi:diguanylate cyclase (GGDEF)-like protein|nr:diguanylate cyclase [Candidatus Omnitrophota bacterium]